MLRLFIAIPVPEDVKRRIGGLVTELEGGRGLPEGVRFVPENNWHFTLVFLGYQPETALSAIKESIAAYKSYLSNRTYRIDFEKLIYGPPGPSPRMIWLTTTRATSLALGKIKKDVEDELEKNGVRWQRESRPYQAHLTLARFLPQPAEDLPLVEEKFDLGYSAEEIHLMKSTLKRTGAEYEVL